MRKEGRQWDSRPGLPGTGFTARRLMRKWKVGSGRRNEIIHNVRLYRRIMMMMRRRRDALSLSLHLHYTWACCCCRENLGDRRYV
jgi:hypothetical protein